MRYELVVLGPGRDVDTDHLESDAPLDLSQPIKLTDGTLVHAIARVDRPGITGIVCHPQTGIRVVFDVDGNLHPLAHDHAVDVAEDLVGYSTHPARDEHEATADRTAAATIERALAETPHCPPVRLSSPQLAQVSEILGLWALDVRDPHDEPAALHAAIRDGGH